MTRQCNEESRFNLSFVQFFQVDYFQDGSAAAGEKKDAKVEMKETPSRRKESRESRDSKEKAEKKEKESEDSKESKEKKEDKKSKEKWKIKITYIIIAFT